MTALEIVVYVLILLAFRLAATPVKS